MRWIDIGLQAELNCLKCEQERHFSQVSESDFASILVNVVSCEVFAIDALYPYATLQSPQTHEVLQRRSLVNKLSAICS